MTIEYSGYNASGKHNAQIIRPLTMQSARDAFGIDKKLFRYGKCAVWALGVYKRISANGIKFYDAHSIEILKMIQTAGIFCFFMHLFFFFFFLILYMYKHLRIEI